MPRMGPLPSATAITKVRSTVTTFRAGPYMGSKLLLAGFIVISHQMRAGLSMEVMSLGKSWADGLPKTTSGILQQ